MDPLVEQVAERRVDQPLALDPRLAGEGRAFDRQAEMAFASRIVAAVAAMLLAVVGQLDRAGSAASSRRSISRATGPVSDAFIGPI